MANKSVKRIRTKKRGTRKNRIMKGGSLNKDQATISQFKERVKSQGYDLSIQFIKDGNLTVSFSDDAHDMHMLLKKNLIENITLNEILSDTYKLLPLPSTADGVDFAKVPTKIDTLEELFQIKPNDMVEWNGFLFKFYDFNIKSHEAYKKSIKFSDEVCKKSIKEEYLTKSMNDCDYLITVSDAKEFDLNKESKPDLTNIYAFTMNNTLNYGTTPLINTYTSSACSMEMVGDEGDKVISFGLLLMYIILNYLKSIGFANGYNDASHTGLLPYYSRWNYRLGKGSCELPEDITTKHNELINLKNSEELDHFYESLTSIKYESSSGYRMKLCGINLDGWREYLLKTNTGIKERLEANESVYVHYNNYKEAIEKQRKIEMLNKQLEEFNKLPGERKTELANDLLEKIVIYDNSKIYDIVVKNLIKDGIITFNDVKSNLMSRIKQSVMPGPYQEFMRNKTIDAIKQKEELS